MLCRPQSYGYRKQTSGNSCYWPNPGIRERRVSGGQCERRVSGKTIRSGSTRSRPRAVIRVPDLPGRKRSFKLPKGQRFPLSTTPVHRPPFRTRPSRRRAPTLPDVLEKRCHEVGEQTHLGRVPGALRIHDVHRWSWLRPVTEDRYQYPRSDGRGVHDVEDPHDAGARDRSFGKHVGFVRAVASAYAHCTKVVTATKGPLVVEPAIGPEVDHAVVGSELFGQARHAVRLEVRR